MYFKSNARLYATHIFGSIMMESKKRSLIKALAWRTVGIFVLGGITWGFTKNIEATTKITFLFHTINLILYYIHERMWEGIEWGFKNKSDLSDTEREMMINRLRKLGYVE